MPRKCLCLRVLYLRASFDLCVFIFPPPAAAATLLAAVLAAVLALIGYSLNDTIVVFDRIRENFRRLRKADPVEIVDISLTETLRRTIMTVATVVLVVVALLFLGGPALKWFSIAMLVGLFAGTYSSIYIATSYALAMGLSKEDFVIAKPKEEFVEEGDIQP